MPVRQVQPGLGDQGPHQLHETTDVPERQDAETVGRSRKGSAESGRGRVKRLPGMNRKSRMPRRPASWNQNPGQFWSNRQVDRGYLRTRPILKRRFVRQLYSIWFQVIGDPLDLRPRGFWINQDDVDRLRDQCEKTRQQRPGIPIAQENPARSLALGLIRSSLHIHSAAPSHSFSRFIEITWSEEI